jgi:hypothetical protein
MIAARLPQTCVDIVLDYYILHARRQKEALLHSLRVLFYGNQADILTRFFFPSASRSYARLDRNRHCLRYADNSMLFMKTYEHWINTESNYINARIWHHQHIDGGRLRYLT